MKSIALLTTALFLASAPSPDSDTISQVSAGFLSSPVNIQPLMAAEPGQATGTSTSIASGTTVEGSFEQLSSQEMLAD